MVKTISSQMGRETTGRSITYTLSPGTTGITSLAGLLPPTLHVMSLLVKSGTGLAHGFGRLVFVLD